MKKLTTTLASGSNETITRLGLASIGSVLVVAFVLFASPCKAEPFAIDENTAFEHVVTSYPVGEETQVFDIAKSDYKTIDGRHAFPPLEVDVEGTKQKDEMREPHWAGACEIYKQGTSHACIHCYNTTSEPVDSVIYGTWHPLDRFRICATWDNPLCQGSCRT
jgi:hypothetical protein